MAHPAIRQRQNRLTHSRSRNPPELQWQSRLLVGCVLPLCGAAALCWLIHDWSRAGEGALLISAVFALAAWAARAGTPPAALAGGLLAATMLLASGEGVHWLNSALPALLAVLLLTYLATHFGRRSKDRLGAAESARGRNTAQVTANLGVAGLAGAAALTLWLTFPRPRAAYPLTGMPGHGSPGGSFVSQHHFWSQHQSWSQHHSWSQHQCWPALCAVMLAAALAEAAADTLSSEIGQVLGGSPSLITTHARVSPGTDGGMSLPGTLAGVAGAAAIALVAMPTLRLSPRATAICAGAAIAGMLFDSLLGATAERRGVLNNDAVNFLSTLASALLAALLLLL